MIEVRITEDELYRRASDLKYRFVTIFRDRMQMAGREMLIEAGIPLKFSFDSTADPVPARGNLSWWRDNLDQTITFRWTEDSTSSAAPTP